MTVIAALGRVWQEDGYEFKASEGHRNLDSKNKVKLENVLIAFSLGANKAEAGGSL